MKIGNKAYLYDRRTAYIRDENGYYTDTMGNGRVVRYHAGLRFLNFLCHIAWAWKDSAQQIDDFVAQYHQNDLVLGSIIFGTICFVLAEPICVYKICVNGQMSFLIGALSAYVIGFSLLLAYELLDNALWHSGRNFNEWCEEIFD